MVVVISSREMGQGDPALGTLLMKGFIYALTQQDVLPETILLYNGGAFLSCEGSDNLEDLKTLEAQGVEILTCGTCLNHYGIGDRLRVGSVTNMYEIAERMTGGSCAGYGLKVGSMNRQKQLIIVRGGGDIAHREPSTAFIGAVIRCWCWKQAVLLPSAGRWHFPKQSMTDRVKLRV